MKISGTDCKEHNLTEEWDTDHAGHPVIRFKHTIYKNKQEIQYECRACLICEQMAKKEIRKRKVSISERTRTDLGRKPRKRNAKKFETYGEKTLYRSRKGRGRLKNDEMFGDMRSDSWGAEW